MQLKTRTRNYKRNKKRSTRSGLLNKVKIKMNEMIKPKPLKQIIRKTMIRKNKKDKRAKRILKRKPKRKTLHKQMLPSLNRSSLTKKLMAMR